MERIFFCRLVRQPGGPGRGSCNCDGAPWSRSSAHRCPFPEQSSARSVRVRRRHCPGAPVALRQLAWAPHSARCPYQAVRVLEKGGHGGGVAGVCVWPGGQVFGAAMAWLSRRPSMLRVLPVSRAGGMLRGLIECGGREAGAVWCSRSLAGWMRGRDCPVWRGGFFAWAVQSAASDGVHLHIPPGVCSRNGP